MYIKNDTRYKYKSVSRVALTAATDTTVSVSPNSYVIIQNQGVGSCYVTFEETANNNKWLLNDGDVFPVIVRCSVIHFYSPTATPVVCVMEMDI